MFWVNGTVCDAVALSDRSFQYGDGCFTTILTEEGEPRFWPEHVERMEQTLQRLMIGALDWQQLYVWVKQAAFADSVAGVKVHISRGTGGRGYSPTQVHTPNVTISAFAFPEHYHLLRQTGVELGLCTARMGLNPLLAGLKHNNRLEQVLLKAEMDKLGLVDGVALDIHGHVIETTMANLFWRRGLRWYTPSLTKAGVSGVMRRQVVAWFAARQQALMVGDFTLPHLLTSDEVFMTNAILSVAPVKAITATTFAIGNTTRSLQEHFTSC